VISAEELCVVGTKILILVLFLFISPIYTGLILPRDSGASSLVDIEAGDWWYYPMVIEAGSSLTCSFSTDGASVEFFIVHESFYAEHTEISQTVMLYHGYSASADFQVSIPSEGGWCWVFINDTNFTVRVIYEWTSIAPFNFLAPQNLWITSLALLGVLGLALVSFIIRRRRVPKSESQKTEEE